MPDLRPRIERLVGRLVGGGGEAAGTAGGSRLDLRPGDGFAEAVAHLVAMPLDRYAREGAPLEFRVPWLEDTLWFVPDGGLAETLVRHGISRGHVWTVGELLAVMPLASHGVVRTIAIAKVIADGDIADVEARRSSADAVPTQEPARLRGLEIVPR